MYELLMIGYEFLASFLPFLLVFIIFSTAKKRKLKTCALYLFLCTVFTVYITGVFHFTGTGTVFDIIRLGFKTRPDSINLIPFCDSYIDVTGYLLNILLFMPLGFLLPLIWKHLNRFPHIILSGLLFSLLIEISQLVNNRATDVDDLIMNTLGALIGFVIFKLFRLIIKKREFAYDYNKLEPFVYILVMFVGRFFLFNEFGLASSIYGF